MDPIKPTFSPNAPSAPQSGMGAGNIPYAPGMASGRFNGPSTPNARLFNPPSNPAMAPHPGNQGSPQGPAGNMGGAGQPNQPPHPGGGPPPGGPPQGMPFGMESVAPAIMNTMQMIFNALWNEANKAQGGGEFF